MKIITFNSEPFQISDIDSDESIRKRVAYKLNTLPRYVYYDKFTHQEIIANTVQSLIQIGDYDIKKISDIIKSKIRIDPKQLVYFFLKVNKYDPDGDFMTTVPLEAAVGSIYNLDNITRVYNEQDEEYTKAFKLFSSEILILSKTLSTLDSKPGLPYTQFEISEIIYSGDLKSDNLLEFLDSLDITSDLPFATVNGYYKLFKGIDTLNPEWPYTGDQNQLKIIYRHNIKTLKKTITIDITIFVLPDKISIGIPSSTLFMFTDNDITNILTSIKNKLNVKDIKLVVDEYKGIYYIPNTSTQKEYFADFITNSPLASDYFYIDEREKTFKDVSGIYFYYKDIGVNLIPKVVLPVERDILKKSREIFPIGSPFLRLRLRGKTMDNIKYFQTLFSKLFYIYKEEEKSIIDDYNKFFPLLYKELKKTDLSERKLRLKDIEPTIFVSGYPTRCPVDKTPVVVDNSLIEESKDETSYVTSSGEVFARTDVKPYKMVIKFPLGDNGRWYGCPNPPYINPGLRENTLKNRDEYPYLPCCYEVRQEVNFKEYYPGLKKVVEEKKRTNIITTDKFVYYNEIGMLPNNLSAFFMSLSNELYEYYRSGISQTTNTFIESVILALSPDLKKEEVIARASKVRKEFINAEYINICKQSMYDFSLEEIKDIIKDEKKYFDPKYFIALLEHKFDCHIYLTSRKEKTGLLIYPRHLNTYLTYKKEQNKRVVIIYEHTGVEFANYPQCEFIIRVDTLVVLKHYSYVLFDNTIKNLDNSYNELVKTYDRDKLVIPIKKPSFFNKVVCQGIDYYGKTRLLGIEHKGKMLYLTTAPLPPLSVSKICDDKYNKKEDVELFLKDEKIPYKIDNDWIIAKKDIVLRFHLAEKKDTISTLQQLNLYQKLARKYGEYVLYLFSWVLFDNKTTELSDKLIDQFFNQYTTLVGQVDNKDIITLPDRFIKTKLPITTVLKKRISYMINHTYIRYYNKLINYKNKELLDKIYLDISDFLIKKDSIVLFGEKALAEWLEKKELIFPLNEIPIDVKTPYFLRIKDNNLFIQPVYSFNQALSLASYINKHKYNPVLSDITETNTIENTDFTLYTYSEDKVEIHDFGASELKILLYKIDGSVKYGVILDI